MLVEFTTKLEVVELGLEVQYLYWLAKQLKLVVQCNSQVGPACSHRVVKLCWRLQQAAFLDQVVVLMFRLVLLQQELLERLC